MKKVKSIGKAILFLLILFFVINFFGILLNPNLKQNLGYSSYKFEAETENSIDVILLGSSFMYCSYSPMEAYEKTGLKSYLVAGPEQSIITSYHNFKKTLETQMPKTVVIEVKGLSFDGNEKYQGNSIVEVAGKKIDLGDVPVIAQVNNLSEAVKGKLVIDWPENFYNFFTFHNKWNELDEEDYKTAALYILSSFSKDYAKGYIKLDEVGEGINPTKGEVKEISESYELNITYLDKIVDLCNENNIEIVFISTPSVNINLYDNYINEVKKRYSDKRIIVMNDIIDELDFNYYEDMFDWGHTNHSGALKITDYMINYFLDNGLIDKDIVKDESWEKNLKEYKNDN